MRFTLLHLLAVTFIALFIGAFGGYSFHARRMSAPVSSPTNDARMPTNFEECVAAGNPVMESYPRQCRANGTTFVEEIDEPVELPADLRNERAGEGCKIGGCGGELCGDAGEESLVSICMLMPQQACYRSARCEKQSTGKCGWTETPVLKACLENPPPLQ